MEMDVTKFRIVPKRDFSGNGFWISGHWVKSGFIVTDGFCNIMPGATWFRSIADAMNALEVFIEVGGNAAKFWTTIRSPLAGGGIN